MKLNKVRAGLANQGTDLRSQNPEVGYHLTPALSPKGGEGEKRLEWWEALAPGEKKLICSLMRMLRGAKRSELRDVAMAAAKWERGIGCFIKVRLIGQAARGQWQRHRQFNQKFTQRRQGAESQICITVNGATAFPSTSRNQLSVSQGRD